MIEMLGELELNKIYCMDAIEFLKKIPDNSIDAIITDPPAGINFMGKQWDNFNKNEKMYQMYVV